MRNKKLFWGSSYDRGLENLLFIWPDIKEKHPDSELHICYGWDLFLKTNSNNPERMAWYERMRVAMDQDGVVHHGRVGKEELKKIRETEGRYRMLQKDNIEVTKELMDTLIYYKET